MSKVDITNEGTSGNRLGYKIFSFNTSVRNPKRNEDFLKAFLPFNGKVFDTCASKAYFCELVKTGIYQFVKVPEYIKTKWENNIELTTEEVDNLMKLNPQATGLHNRVLTSWTRTLKDQGFLICESDPNGSSNHIFRISKLGYDLLDKNKDMSIIYTKAMIGIHSSNPARKKMFNKSRPFLNTLFVIDLVNKKWSEMGNEPKGILKHEFGAFVLSMKDCNYKQAANDIIAYRKKFKYKINMDYIYKYLASKDLLPFSEKSICKDYPDDVFRKFEMTGLISMHGKFSNIYYNISDYNKEKAEQIMNLYSDYKFEEFDSVDEYYDYLYNVQIPWEQNEMMRRKIAEAKAFYLGREFNDKISLEDEEMQLDRAYFTSALDKAINKYDIKTILKELMILSGIVKDKSKFQNITESLRLEYLLALAIGKIYGTNGLVSNIIYNEEGEPMHWALGKQCDIILFREHSSLILEPTMLSTRDQQMKNETAAITRHAITEKEKHDLDFRVIMIAPKVHADTIDYFTYRSNRNNLKLLTLTIAKMVGLFGENHKYDDFINEVDTMIEFFKSHDDDFKYCADLINSYKPNENLYS